MYYICMPPQHSAAHELPLMENPHKGGAGPTVGIIIIVLILIIGALYTLGGRLTQTHAENTLPLIPASSQ